MRTFAISDIHNCYLGIKQAVERADIKPTDKFIFLGDYLDGWSQAKETIKFLWELQETNECVFIMGNHDEWVLEWLLGKYSVENGSLQHWCKFGGQNSKDSLETWFKEDSTAKSRLTDWLMNLQTYHLDNEDRLFLHAGFETFQGVENEKDQRVLWWTRDLVKGALRNSSEHINKLKRYKEVFVGHSPSRFIVNNTTNEAIILRALKHLPIQVENFHMLDTGAAFDGKVILMDIDTKEIWQSDPVRQLYPNELGRNNA